MSIDTFHQTDRPPQTSHLGQLRHPRRSRWWKRSLLAAAALLLVSSSAALVAITFSAEDGSALLTHTITRSDLRVTITEQGILESSENTEIKCKVRGRNAVLWIVESGTMVEAGDELVRLDSLFIQEQIDERTKYAHWSRSAAERSAADVVRAGLAISEYEQGRYVAQLMRIKKDLVIAEANLRSAKNRLSHAAVMAKSGYISELEVEERDFAVKQAELSVKLKQTEVDVLTRFTQAEQSQTLKGNLAATKARHEANVERAMADKSRRDRALAEIEHCVIRADRSGLVIHPNAAKWEFAPIAEGTNVHKDQILLLMPDLSKMQVKVGIHESMVDRIQEGLSAQVTLPDKTLAGTVSSVASVTRPAGWWTGNEVRYDTLIRLPSVEGLRPGMSAEVEVTIAAYKNVLTIPVAAIVESDESQFCWVKKGRGLTRRMLKLGDTNDVFTIVEEGLREGEEVLLNPPKSSAAYSPTGQSPPADGLL